MYACLFSQRGGLLRDDCFAECLRAEICNVPLDSQYLGSDFVLYPQICRIHVFKRPMTLSVEDVLCGFLRRWPASTGFITYPRSHSNDTIPFDSDAPNAAAYNSDSALILEMMCCLRV